MTPLRRLIIFSSLVLFVFSATLHAAPADNLSKGVLLVATKRLNETGYEKAVIFVTEHSDAGSYGVIINRKTDVPLEDVIPEAKVRGKNKNWVYFGGPMHAQFLFVITQTHNTKGLHQVNKDIYFGAGKEAIAQVSAKKSTDPFRTYAGFASWGPGQLAEEINGGAWVLAPGDSSSLFTETSDQLWQNLMDRWAGSWI
ncbi:MAG: YqgE/AlgH family protein [Gammaproteobacteria bacterium]|nr:YqgE/AlgH family protein [Gammaproteobacteria bacterium]MDH5692783.1 YqgE/AlgH family protein [Gammaproteobacteria bacterium]